MDLLSNSYFGNTLLAWSTAAALAVLTYVLLRVVAVSLVRRVAGLAAKTSAHWDDVVTSALLTTKGFLLFFVALFVGSSVLALAPGTTLMLQRLATIALIVQAGIWIGTAIRRWLEIQHELRVADDAAMYMTMNVIGIATRIALWSVVLLLILENAGIDVTALVAGLGVGGIAVALAAQSILGDLFASLSIVFDRPFVIGDFLTVGDLSGSVEEIGLKTTRLRSLSGEQLVFSNTDLLGSRIHNYGRMFQRRVSFSLGVTYQTPRASLEAIPGIVREAIEEHGEQVRFDRSHLKAYGDSAILYETVYYVLAADYNLYMDIQQAINLRIHERFEADGIEFAYPTQTLFVVKQEASPALTA